MRRLRYQELQSGATAAQHAFVLLCAEVYDHLYNDDEASAEEGDVPGRVGCRTRTSTTADLRRRDMITE